LNSLAFSWAGSYVSRIAEAFGNVFDLRIVVGDTWRHVFIVLWLLFFRDATVAFSDGRRVLAVVRGVAGLIIAVVFSVFASASVHRGDVLYQNVHLAVVPYFGIYAYDLVMYAVGASRVTLLPVEIGWRIRLQERWIYFRLNAVRAHLRLGLILASLVLWFLIPGVSLLPYPIGGLYGLGIATVANMMYWVVRGIFYSIRKRQLQPQNQRNSLGMLFRESEAGRFALAVGSVVVWVFTFLLLNTGAAMLGL
jgi:hypothetical protein